MKPTSRLLDRIREILSAEEKGGRIVFRLMMFFLFYGLQFCAGVMIRFLKRVGREVLWTLRKFLGRFVNLILNQVESGKREHRKTSNFCKIAGKISRKSWIQVSKNTRILAKKRINFFQVLNPNWYQAWRRSRKELTQTLAENRNAGFYFFADLRQVLKILAKASGNSLKEGFVLIRNQYLRDEKQIRGMLLNKSRMAAWILLFFFSWLFLHGIRNSLICTNSFFIGKIRELFSLARFLQKSIFTGTRFFFRKTLPFLQKAIKQCLRWSRSLEILIQILKKWSWKTRQLFRLKILKVYKKIFSWFQIILPGFHFCRMAVFRFLKSSSQLLAAASFLTEILKRLWFFFEKSLQFFRVIIGFFRVVRLGKRLNSLVFWNLIRWIRRQKTSFFKQLHQNYTFFSGYFRTVFHFFLVFRRIFCLTNPFFTILGFFFMGLNQIQQKCFILSRIIQRPVSKGAGWCRNLTILLRKLAQLKIKGFLKLHRRHREFHCRIKGNNRSLDRVILNFLRRLLLTNWLKAGYALSIFLVLSLTVYSFSRGPLEWEDSNPGFAGRLTVALDLSDPESASRLQELYESQIQLVPVYQDSDCVIRDSFSPGDRVLQLEGTAVVVHPENPLRNLTRNQLQSILSGQVQNWKGLSGQDAAIHFLKDQTSGFGFEFAVSEEEKLPELEKRILQDRQILALVSLKNLSLKMKPLMVDYHYPARSAILQKLYPLGSFASLHFRSKDQKKKAAADKIFKEAEITSIIAGGDVIWDRGVATKIRQKGHEYLLRDLRKLFQTASLALLNLENPVSLRGAKYNLDKGIFFRGHPDSLQILKDLGIHLVSLANNHMFDYGMTAALDTLVYLKESGIRTTGFGLDRQEALLGEVFELGGKKIRFLGYNTVYPRNVDVSQNIPGIVMVNESQLKEEIQRAKKGVDQLYLIVHSGEEFSYFPEKRKIQLYRKMLDYGADGIIGGHPHVVQSFEIYQGKPLIYSLGNLIFDQYRLPETRDELVMELIFSQGRLAACFPHFFKVNPEYQPQEVKHPELETLLTRMEQISGEARISKKTQEEALGEY